MRRLQAPRTAVSRQLISAVTPPGTISSPRAHGAEMVASAITLTRRAALGLALLPALRRPAVAADLKDIVSTPSGLRYVDFAPGSGAPPRFGQLVRFHYVGYIASEDGESLEAYDSSYERNTPYFTKHGNGLTCEGLEEALHTMRPGGRRRVLLPPSLGYSRGSASDKGPLPVKATLRDRLFEAVGDGRPLVFDLELVSVVTDVVDRGDYEDGDVQDLMRQIGVANGGADVDLSAIGKDALEVIPVPEGDTGVRLDRDGNPIVR